MRYKIGVAGAVLLGLELMTPKILDANIPTAHNTYNFPYESNVNHSQNENNFDGLVGTTEEFVFRGNKISATIIRVDPQKYEIRIVSAPKGELGRLKIISSETGALG